MRGNFKIDISRGIRDTATMNVYLEGLENLTSIANALRCPLCWCTELVRKGPRQAIYCCSCGRRTPLAKDKQRGRNNVIFETLATIAFEDAD